MPARVLRVPAFLSAVALVALAVPSLASAAAKGGAPTTAAPHLVRPSAIRMQSTARAVPEFEVLARHNAPSIHLLVAAQVVGPLATRAPAAATVPRRPATVQTVPAPRIAGEEALLSIPSLGIRLPIVLGDQATIDRGLVTHYQASGWRPPVAAGAPGTYWLAAHHATHGAPFAALPGIRAGALVIIDPVNGPEIRYQVTSMQVVGTTADNLTVYGADSTSARILLQTCEGGAYRLLVHGIRIS